jgi:hypothetical protein
MGVSRDVGGSDTGSWSVRRFDSMQQGLPEALILPIRVRRSAALSPILLKLYAALSLQYPCCAVPLLILISISSQITDHVTSSPSPMTKTSPAKGPMIVTEASQNDRLIFLIPSRPTKLSPAGNPRTRLAHPSCADSDKSAHGRQD